MQPRIQANGDHVRKKRKAVKKKKALHEKPLIAKHGLKGK